MILFNNDTLHERVVEHLKKNGVEVPYVLARNILYMCDEALRDAPENTSSNSDYTKCQWIQIRDGVSSIWVSSCGGRKLKETFEKCPVCGFLVEKHFA